MWNALDSRVFIEQGKGVLDAHHCISVDAAFSLLRDHALDHNLRPSYLARQVADGSTIAAALLRE